MKLSVLILRTKKVISVQVEPNNQIHSIFNYLYSDQRISPKSFDKLIIPNKKVLFVENAKNTNVQAEGITGDTTMLFIDEPVTPIESRDLFLEIISQYHVNIVFF
eukprot:c21983_g2_i2.p1 GENE.c21983_g2_i2~~c21983_g2_i2.p1  ORF type:complete len:119 (-),score=9.24 c21983_g2_i2:31-345(-)